jgi:hypothetical protein
MYNKYVYIVYIPMHVYVGTLRRQVDKYVDKYILNVPDIVLSFVEIK